MNDSPEPKRDATTKHTKGTKGLLLGNRYVFVFFVLFVVIHLLRILNVDLLKNPAVPPRRDRESPEFKENSLHFKVCSLIPLQAGPQAAGNALAVNFQF